VKALYSASRMIFNEKLIEKLKSIEDVDICVHIDHGKAPDCDISEIEYIFNTSVLNYHDVRKFTSLKQIQLFSAGMDRVPMDVVEELGLTIKRATDVYSIPIAEFVLMRVLEIYKDARYFEDAQKNKSSNKNRKMEELSGKTAGIIGYGSIGREIAKRLKAFDVNIIGFSRTKKEDEYLDEHCLAENLLDRIGACDVVILTMPYSDEYDKFFGKAFFNAMKDHSVFVNIARGMLVDEPILIDNIKKGKFLGVALDVTYEEPLDPNSELWTLDNVYLSPHNSFASNQIYDRLFQVCYDNLKEYMEQREQ